MSVPAYADMDITIFGAAQHQGKLNLQTAQGAATTTSNFDPRTFGEFGVRYSHGRVIGGEHTLAYVPKFITSSGKAVIYSSDLLLQVPSPKVKPYVTVGLGSVFTSGSDAKGLKSLSNFGSKFAINYGGGVKVLPAGPVGVRFDIRGYTVPSVKLNVVNSLQTGTVQAQDQSLNFYEVGLGIVFKVGK